MRSANLAQPWRNCSIVAADPLRFVPQIVLFSNAGQMQTIDGCENGWQFGDRCLFEECLQDTPQNQLRLFPEQEGTATLINKAGRSVARWLDLKRFDLNRSQRKFQGSQWFPTQSVFARGLA